MVYHNYISLYLFYIFIFYLLLEIDSFTPKGRSTHSSVLVGDKLYYFGGVTNGCSNEVFYLDVSQPFNIASPPFNELAGMPIKSCWQTVSLSNINNEQSIYLFSGIALDAVTNSNLTTSFTYKFNLKSGQWEIPIIKGKIPERRRNACAVNDNSGKIHIFGGITDPEIGSPTTNYLNDMIVFNVAESSWTISYQFNAPTPRSSYTATLLSNGVIIYVGGYGKTGNVDISQISLYDTNSSTWSVKTASPAGLVQNRLYHEAVLAPDGKIIIHGGISPTTATFDTQATPDIVVLNTETFEWIIPSISSNIGKVPSLAYHTANLVGNHMIVAFGKFIQPNAQTILNSNIYVMDIRSFTWVNTFEPVKPTNSSTPVTPAKPTSISENLQDPNQSTTIKIVIATVSGVVGTAVLMIIGFFGYKWYQRYQRRKHNEILKIHGNNSSQNEILRIHGNNTPYN